MKKIDISRNVRHKLSIQGWCILLLALIVVIFLADAVYRMLNRDENIEQTNYVVVTDENFQETALPTLDEDTEATEVTTEAQTIDSTLYSVVNKSAEDIGKGALAVINAEHPTTFPDLTDKLSNFYYAMGNSYKMSTFEINLYEEAIEPFNNMMDDFYAQYGINYVTIVGGYTDESSDDSDGTSDSCSGYGLDFKVVTDSQILDFDGTGDYSWIESNCYKYGYVLRYPESAVESTGVEYIPSHFRYVGIPHSNIMQDKNLCLEDYVEFLKGYNFYDEHLYVTLGNIEYEIYYVPAEGDVTQVPVPKDRYYSISGNNIDGFIVTSLK
jgi:D-alanyl-D-alanine carboxypeptidase